MIMCFKQQQLLRFMFIDTLGSRGIFSNFYIRENISQASRVIAKIYVVSPACDWINNDLACVIGWTNLLNSMSWRFRRVRFAVKQNPL